MTLSLIAALAPSALAGAPSQDLAGDWRFALDRADRGVAASWFTRDLADRITLPGVLQAQGYGDEISPETPWVVGLGDAWWKLQPEELRAHFSQPGRVEVPFLAQPPRHYLGAAWYQRDLEIPADWAGRRVQLLLERPHWETTVWLDGERLGSNNSLVAPHEYELGSPAPGRHRLTIRIDNRQIVRDPAGDGHGVDSHAVSDALGATWNGIAGRIELVATSPVWLDDVQVYPVVATKSARVQVKLGNATGRAGTGRLTVGDRSVEVTWDASGGTAEVEVALGAGARTWDEFQPVLHKLEVALTGGGADDRRTVIFGLREISWDEKDLLINGRVVNMRTTHFGGDFPLTGYPATDVESWKRIIRTCQEFGMNGIRFHSWCPPEAAFIAADELGFYLAPELGLWAPFNPDSVYTRYMEEETPRLLRAYGNHPSFVLFSPSNEPSGRYTTITPQWAAAWYQRDPRHLYAAGTGWNRPAQVVGGAQFAALVRFGQGELRNATGWFGGDYRQALEGVKIPVLAHETGQWCAYPDFDVIKKFTGYLRPGNYNIFRYIAEQEGVLASNHAFAFASGRFQFACYKEEIEANLRTPGLAGYQLLDLHDYIGQGTALIGVLDTFWEPKSYVTAEAFRRFNAATVPLARLKQRTFASAETLETDVELYHFGEAALAGAVPYWKVVDAAGQVVAGGEWEARDIPVGKNIPLGRVQLGLATLASPGAYRLAVGLTGTTVENDWNFWVYPAPVEVPAPAGVLVTGDWAGAKAALEAGGRVLFVPGKEALDPRTSPPMKDKPVFWNIQMTVRPPRNLTPRFDAMLGLLCEPEHPALAGFPTEVNCDWQWTPLVNDVRSVNLRHAPRTLQPIVAAIDDWNRNWRLGVLFECRVGTGRLMVSVVDVLTPEFAGAIQLRRSLLDYMAGDKFQPAATLTGPEIDALWAREPVGVETPGGRTFDADLDDGSNRPRRRPAGE